MASIEMHSTPERMKGFGQRNEVPGSGRLATGLRLAGEEGPAIGVGTSLRAPRRIRLFHGLALAA